MRSKTGASLLLLATFFIGGIAGAVTYHLYHNRAGADSAKVETRRNSHDIVSEMAGELNLDKGQKDSLSAIIKQSRERYRSLSREFRPHYEKIRLETREAIRAILRPDQQARFEETLRKMDARHNSRGRNTR